MNAVKERLKSEYTQMMETPAWKNLVAYAENERDASIKSIDDKSAADLNINVVCEQRGIRKGIFKLIQHAEQCRDGV